MNTTLISSFALVGLLFSGDEGGEPRAAGVDSVLRTYDLAALRIDYSAGAQGRAGESLFPNTPQTWFQADVGGEDPMGHAEPTDPYTVMELLQIAMVDEWDYAERDLRMDERGNLTVIAPPQLHDRVASLLRELEAVVSSTVELKVDLVTLTGPAMKLSSHGMTTRAEAQRLIERAGVEKGGRRSMSVRARVGETGTIDLARQVSYVADYDVEIAQGSFIYDPIVQVVSVGLLGHFRATPLRGGLALALFLRDGELLAMEEQNAELKGFVMNEAGSHNFIQGPDLIQSPKMLTRAVALNTFIADDMALVLPLQLAADGDSTELLVIRTGNVPLSSTHAGGELVIASLESLAPPVYEVSGSCFDGALGGGTWSCVPREAMFERGLAALAVGNRSDALERLQWGGGPLPGLTLTYGPWALFPGLSSLEELSEAARLSADTRVVQVDLELKRGAESLARTSLPVRAGASGAAVIGLTNSILGEYDVEVAQFAGVVDPQMFEAFDGLAVRVRASYGPSGELSLEVNAEAQDRGEADRVDLGGQALRSMELFDSERLLVHERLSASELADGRAVALGNDQEGGLALMVSAR